MKISDLIESPNEPNRLSITKVAALAGQAVLIVGFGIQARYRDLDWSDWIGFALALTIVSGGPLANRVISIWAGKTNGASTPMGKPS